MLPRAEESAAVARASSAAAALPHRRYWVYFFLFCLATINFIDRVVISVDAQPIAKEFSLSPIALGYLFSSYLWTYTLCQIPVGIAVDRWNTRGPLAIGVAVWSLATALTGAMVSFPGLLATRLALGMGEAVALPGTSKTTRQWAPVGERGFAFAIPSSGLYFGPAIGSLLVAGLTDLFGWRGAFFVTGAIGLVWVAAWLRWYRKPEEATWLTDGERQRILSSRAGDVSRGERRLSAQYGLLLRSRTMWGLMLTAGCCVYTQYLFLSWLPNYLQTTRHLSMMGTGVYASIPFAIAFVLSLCIGKLSDRVLSVDSLRSGNRRVIIAIVILCATPVLFIPLIDPLWLIIGIVGIALAGVASAISQGGALLTELLRDPQSQAKAQSLFVIGGNCFGMTAPIVTGYVISVAGSYSLGFVIAGALLLLGATCILLTTREPIAE